MGLMNFIKKFKKPKSDVDKAFDLINEIYELIKKQLNEGNVLDSYHKLKLDINYLNCARMQLQTTININDKSSNEANDKENNNQNESIIKELSLIKQAAKSYKCKYDNSNRKTRKSLELGYKNAIEYLEKVRAILEDKNCVCEYVRHTKEGIEKEIDDILKEDYDEEKIEVKAIVSSLNKLNNNLLEEVTEIITYVLEERFSKAAILIERVRRRKDCIIKYAELLLQNVNIIDENINDKYIEKIIDICEKIETNLNILQCNLRIITLDCNLNNSKEINEFKKVIIVIRNCYEEINSNVVVLKNELCTKYHNETFSQVELNDDNNVFTVEYFTKYYYYDKEELENEWQNSDEILKNIETKKQFKIDNFVFRYTKSGMIVATKTKENVKFKFDLENKNLYINNKKVILNLNEKFKVDILPNNTRIITTTKELKNSIDCIMYISNSISDEFIDKLKIIRNINI